MSSVVRLNHEFISFHERLRRLSRSLFYSCIGDFDRGESSFRVQHHSVIFLQTWNGHRVKQSDGKLMSLRTFPSTNLSLLIICLASRIIFAMLSMSRTTNPNGTLVASVWAPGFVESSTNVRLRCRTVPTRVAFVC